MEAFDKMLEFNRRWAADMVAQDSGYFTRHAAGQTPHTLFIGCSDSRVQTNTLTGTEQGEMFVHRNIANQVYGSDLNVLSAVDYAVDVLDVKHIIVCGHYGCGGVRAAAAAESPTHGLTDHWLSQLRTIKRLHKDELDACGEGEARLDRLAELNVLEQVHNLAATPVIRDSWARGRRPVLHGIVYDIRTGLLKELATRIDGVDRIESIFGTTG
ncbi:MAG: carbonic anhydrase [Gemmatimonadales bacterium]